MCPGQARATAVSGDGSGSVGNPIEPPAPTPKTSVASGSSRPVPECTAPSRISAMSAPTKLGKRSADQLADPGLCLPTQHAGQHEDDAENMFIHPSKRQACGSQSPERTAERSRALLGPSSWWTKPAHQHQQVQARGVQRIPLAKMQNVENQALYSIPTAPAKPIAAAQLASAHIQRYPMRYPGISSISHPYSRPHPSSRAWQAPGSSASPIGARAERAASATPKRWFEVSCSEGSTDHADEVLVPDDQTFPNNALPTSFPKPMPLAALLNSSGASPPSSITPPAKPASAPG